MAAGNGRWQVWAGIGVPAVGVLGTLATLIYWIAGMALKVTSQEVAIAAMQTRIELQAASITKMQVDTTTQRTSLNEIETQFCANDIVRNLIHANDMRHISILWKKAFGETFPTDNPYYPNICNRKPQ